MKGLEEIVEELAPRLLGYCLGSCRDAAMAEDAAQDGLAALVRRWRLHGPPDSPEAFVFMVARRRLGRAALRRKLVSPLDTLRGRAAAGSNPERTAAIREELSQVVDALEALPHQEREALLLSTVAELPLAKVAEVTGSSLAAVKMRIHRARRHVGRLLEIRRDG